MKGHESHEIMFVGTYSTALKVNKEKFKRSIKQIRLVFAWIE